MKSEDLQNILKRHGLKPNFTYGQNFLLDEAVLDKMLKASNISTDDAVFEIGPGIGNLTQKLCEEAGEVVSVEKDPKFLPILKSLAKNYKNFHFEIADALEFDFQKYFIERGRGEKGYKVVANIPYFVTGKILQVLTSAKFKPKSVTVLMQKEVAERVAAKPGEMSILSVAVQIFGEPTIAGLVGAESFYPAPKVDSAILHIDMFEQPRYEIEDEKKFFSLVKSCFAGKRKQIHNTLNNNYGLDKDVVLKLLDTIGVKPEARPQELSLEQWIALYKNLVTSKLLAERA
jgi:16S rRNA (adenine1518-N6/adenine1519-N6)-dimethyltransferase